MSKLLRYLVDATINGKSASLKSSVIAVDVMGRSDDFDSSTDSSARVQMVRLRRSLESYYAMHAPVDEQCIYLPAGSYTLRLGKLSAAYPMLYRPLSDSTNNPVQPESEFLNDAMVAPFGASAAGSSALPHRSRFWRMGAVVIVGLAIGAAVLLWQQIGRSGRPQVSPVLELAPIDTGGQPELAQTARLVMNMFANDLGQFKLSRIRVVGKGDAPRQPTDHESVYRLSSQLITNEQSGYTLYLGIDDVRSGTLLWSREVQLPQGQRAISSAVIPVLGEINGPMGIISMHGHILTKDRNDGGYPCLLKYFAFIRMRDKATEDQVAACFDKPSPEHGMDATLLAARAMFAIERRSARDNILVAAARATDFARAAVAADPNDGSANFALARLSYFRRDCVSARFYTARTMETNPNSPMFTATLAALAKTCRYPDAEALLDQAFLAQSPHFARGRLLLVMAAIAQERPEKIAELHSSDLPQSPYNRTNYYLAESLIAVSQGRRDDAIRFWKLFSPGDQTPDQMLANIVALPEMRQQLIGYLRNAGIIDLV